MDHLDLDGWTNMAHLLHSALGPNDSSILVSTDLWEIVLLTRRQRMLRRYFFVRGSLYTLTLQEPLVTECHSGSPGARLLVSNFDVDDAEVRSPRGTGQHQRGILRLERTRVSCLGKKPIPGSIAISLLQRLSCSRYCS